MLFRVFSENMNGIILRSILLLFSHVSKTYKYIYQISNKRIVVNSVRCGIFYIYLPQVQSLFLEDKIKALTLIYSLGIHETERYIQKNKKVFFSYFYKMDLFGE